MAIVFQSSQDMTPAPATPWRSTHRGAILGFSAVVAVLGCHKPAAPISLEGTPFDPAVPTPYVLYPGDQILIRYPSDSTLDQEVRIRSDGKIALPYVGEVQAAGRSPEELVAELNTRYHDVLKKPDVTVIVVEETGRVVYVGGQVRAPGSLALRPNQTLLQALYESGGLTPQAEPTEIVLLRPTVDQGLFVIRTDASKIQSGEQPDIALRPWDIVHVPESRIANLNRWVEQYISGMIPRPTVFNFTTELATQPIRILDNGSSFAPVQISRATR